MSAAAILDIYLKWAPKIFVKPKLRTALPLLRDPSTRAAVRQRVGAVVTPRRYGNARYSAEGIESLYRDCLGDARLGDALTDVIVPAYDWKAGRAVVFRSRVAKHSDFNPTMVDVSRATSAAPTYFPPMRMTGEGGRELVCIDGGIAANNPSTVAYYEALVEERELGVDSDFLIVSLGTGRPPEEIPTYTELWSRGWLTLGMGMLNVVFDGTSEIADELMRVIMSAKEPHSRYFRFQTDLRGCASTSTTRARRTWLPSAAWVISWSKNGGPTSNRWRSGSWSRRPPDPGGRACTPEGRWARVPSSTGFAP